MAAGLVAATAVGVPRAVGGPLWDACPDRVTEYRDHVIVRGPRFPSGQQALSSIATDPQNMAAVVGTNGSGVAVTDDVGCTWSSIFTAVATADSGPITVVGIEGNRVRAFAPVRRLLLNGPGLYTFRLLVRDGSVESAVVLPETLAAQECTEVRRCFVRFAPGRGFAVGYVVTPGFADGLLARVGSTTDGGKTWAEHEPPTVDDRAVPVTDLAVDPDNDAHILVVAGGHVFASSDRGETWTEASVPTPLTNAARVLFADAPAPELLLDTEESEEEPLEPAKPRDAVLLDRSSGGTAVLASADDGTTFAPSGIVIPAEPVRDVVVGPSPFGPALVVAAGGRLFRERPLGDGFDTLVGQAAAISQVASSSAAMWLQRSGALAWVDGLTDPTALPLPGTRFGRGRPPAAGALRGRASGGQLHVGDRVTVPPGAPGVGVVTADLGRQPRGLDVFLLFDTSGSMSAKIQPMGQALSTVVEALNKEGIAARFGLGEIGSRAWRYRRHADLGTPPEEVQRRIAALQASGGEEYHYTAFYQIATGKGMQAVTGGSIPPGQQASYEPGALHILLTATDETDNTDPEGPTEGAALAALAEADIRHIGIYPYDGGPRDASNEPVTQALRRYAEGTSTFAPAGGLDCDGDGRVDIPENKPIACAIPGHTSANAPIATLLERVLLSLANDLPVSLEPGPSPLGVDVFPLGDYSALDMHRKHTGLEFRVQVTCPVDRQGSDADIPLELHVGGVAVAAATLPVTCLAPPAQPPAPAPPEEEPVPPARRAAPRLLPAVPPAASTPPALAQSTAAAEASSSASSSAHAVQAGMAWAPEDMPQVAAAHENDTNFVAVRTGAMGLVLLFALFYVVEARVATSLVRVRNRRDPRW